MFRRLAFKFQQFMLGRRGMDTCGTALLVAYLIASFLMNFCYRAPALYYLFWALSLLALVFFFVRFFSRNLQKREAENRKVQKFFRGVKNRFRDRKTHIYFKCPACKNTLRVPKGRGGITVTCPVCREQIRKRT